MKNPVAKRLSVIAALMLSASLACLFGCAAQPSQSSQAASEAQSGSAASQSAQEPQSPSAASQPGSAASPASQASQPSQSPQAGQPDGQRAEGGVSGQSESRPVADFGNPGNSVVEEFDSFRLIVPAEVAEGLTIRRESSDCVTVYCGDVALFRIFSAFDAPATEWKHRVYSLGLADDGAGPRDVYVDFFYVTADGQHDAHWGDASANTLALDYFLAYSEREAFSGIFLRDSTSPSGWSSCVPAIVSDDAETTPANGGPAQSGGGEAGGAVQGASGGNAGSADDPAGADANAPVPAVSDVEPFWGVWAAAYKDHESAEEFAAEARQGGWPSASVFMTTDWDNLNPEPWYVISLDRCASQGQAEASAAQADSEGFEGAYAKYSGEYIGL